MTEPTLFPDLQPLEVEPVEKLSADRRRTARQRAAVAAGRHPLAGGPVQSDPERTCGTCAHRVIVGHHNRSWPKCTKVGGMSHSAASDVRAWWPGCRYWEGRES